MIGRARGYLLVMLHCRFRSSAMSHCGEHHTITVIVELAGCGVMSLLVWDGVVAFGSRARVEQYRLLHIVFSYIPTVVVAQPPPSAARFICPRQIGFRCSARYV
jgi:hypothetical protein